jgi:hypothetical protein
MSTLHETLRWALDARDSESRPTAVCFTTEGDDAAQRWEDAVVPDGWPRHHVPVANWRECGAALAPETDRVLIVAPFARAKRRRRCRCGGLHGRRLARTAGPAGGATGPSSATRKAGAAVRGAPAQHRVRDELSVCRSGRQTPAPSRFLRLPARIGARDLRKELSSLFKQGGGTTPHGYVHREPLDTERPLQLRPMIPRVWNGANGCAS